MKMFMYVVDKLRKKYYSYKMSRIAKIDIEDLIHYHTVNKDMRCINCKFCIDKNIGEYYKNKCDIEKVKHHKCHCTVFDTYIGPGGCCKNHAFSAEFLTKNFKRYVRRKTLRNAGFKKPEDE